MLEVVTTIADVEVRSHTFALSTPAMTEKYKFRIVARRVMGQDHGLGHRVLRRWPEQSPWQCFIWLVGWGAGNVPAGLLAGTAGEACWERHASLAYRWEVSTL